MIATATGTIVHMQRAIRNCRTRVDHQKSLSKCQQQFLHTSNDNLPVREMGCSKFKVQQIKIPGVYKNTIFSVYFLGGYGFPHVF